jgi:hypothetical protein
MARISVLVAIHSPHRPARALGAGGREHGSAGGALRGGAGAVCRALRSPPVGLPHLLEAMRYRDPTDDAKILWLVEAREWNAINGSLVSTVAAITWLDEGTP